MQIHGTEKRPSAAFNTEKKLAKKTNKITEKKRSKHDFVQKNPKPFFLLSEIKSKEKKRNIEKEQKQNKVKARKSSGKIQVWEGERERERVTERESNKSMSE